MSVSTAQSGFSEISPDFWIFEEPLSFYGIQMGRKMIVIRLKSGELFINSPAQLTDSLRTGLDELGPVRYVIPTSRFHGHMFMDQYTAAYLGAELFAAPGLPAKRKDLSFDGLLGSTPDPRWAEEIDQVAFVGNRFITEIEFFAP